MSSERRSKWDRPAENGSAQNAVAVTSVADARPGMLVGAHSAAKAAAAAAARIAAQFTKGTDAAGPGALMRHPAFDEEGPDGAFKHDIEINDHRNRYLLTKSQTLDNLRYETGARVYTRGTWYPDRSKARASEPPLYLHVTADSRESLDRCVARINELMMQDLPPLLDDRLHRNDPRVGLGWPEEKVIINLEPLRNFNVRAKIVGPNGLFVKYIQHETKVRVQIKGKGSGYVETETGREMDDPMHIHLSGPESVQVRRARDMAVDLLDAVTAEWKRARAASGLAVEDSHDTAPDAAPLPDGEAPPPPPEDGDVPPPPEDEAPRMFARLTKAPPPTDAPPEDVPPPQDNTAQPAAAAAEDEEEAALRQYWKDYVAWEQSFVNYHGRRPTRDEGGQDVPPEYRTAEP